MSTAPSALPALPASVQLAPGTGGLPVVRVTGRAGQAEVYLHGAQVTSWTPTGGSPVLWLSRESRFSPDTAIRGGVPICFPWFGANPVDKAAPAHGFARLTDWELAGAVEVGDDVAVTFRLIDSPATLASAWPHPFEARYTVTVGATLRLELQVTNRGTDAVTFEEALHSYFAVDDIRSATISGLEAAPYLDQLAALANTTEAGPVRFTAETDRIYLANTAAATISAGERSITVAGDNSNSTIVWNPWIDKAASMADFGDDEWTGMVCVETANVRTDAVRLEPGQSHTMSTLISATA